MGKRHLTTGGPAVWHPAKVWGHKSSLILILDSMKLMVFKNSLGILDVGLWIDKMEAMRGLNPT